MLGTDQDAQSVTQISTRHAFNTASVSDRWLSEMRARIEREDSGSVYALHGGDAEGWIVSVTNRVVSGDAETALREIWQFALMLARLNPAIARNLVIGWWRSPSADELFIDVGLVVPSGRIGRSVGRAFEQQAMADVRDGVARIVAVRRWASWKQLALRSLGNVTHLVQIALAQANSLVSTLIGAQS